MGISFWSVTAAVLSAFFCFSAADIAQSSFLSRNTNNDDLYSSQYDLIEEGAEDDVNHLPHTSPFHEIYSLKGKDGEIQRIHYATDNKGVRANFHSNAVQLPQNFVSVPQRSPYAWYIGSEAEETSHFNNPLLLPYSSQLRYPKISVPGNKVENDSYQVRHTEEKALAITKDSGTQNKENQQKQSQDKDELLTSDVHKESSINAVGRHQPIVSSSYEQNLQVIGSVGQYQPIVSGPYEQVPQTVDSIEQHLPIVSGLYEQVPPQAVDSTGQYQTIVSGPYEQVPQSVNSFGQYQPIVPGSHKQNYQAKDSTGGYQPIVFRSYEQNPQVLDFIEQKRKLIPDVSISNTVVSSKGRENGTSNELKNFGSKSEPASGTENLNLRSSRQYESPVFNENSITDILRISKIPKIILPKTNLNSLKVKDTTKVVTDYPSYSQNIVPAKSKNTGSSLLNTSTLFQNPKSNVKKPDVIETRSNDKYISGETSKFLPHMKIVPDVGSQSPFQVIKFQNKLTEKDKKFLSNLEKLDLKSKMSSPMSTVFDISNKNGHFYHYILNMGKPEEKFISENNKYYSTGNALFTLLNETGISYMNKETKIKELPTLKNSKKGLTPSTSKPVATKTEEYKYTNSPISSASKSVIRNTEDMLEKWVKEKVKEALYKKMQNTLNETSETKLFNDKSPTTTESNLDISLVTSINSPTGLLSEVNMSTLFDDPSNNTEKEMETPTTMKSLQISVLKSETEDIEKFPIFITIPNLSMDMSSVPDISTTSSSLDDKETTDTARLTTVFVTKKDLEEIEESTTVLPTTVLSEKTTKYNNTEIVETTTFPTTTEASSTTGMTTTDENNDTTTTVSTEVTLIESTTNSNTTLSPSLNATDIFVTIKENISNSLFLTSTNNDTKSIQLEDVTSNPEARNVSVLKHSEPIVKLLDNFPNTTRPMMVIQVTNMDDLMSRIDDLPFELIDLFKSPINTVLETAENNTKELNNSETTEVKENASFNEIVSKNIKQSQLLPLTEALGLKDVESSNVNNLVQKENEMLSAVNSPQNVYTLLHPMLVDHNFQNYPQLSQNEAQSTIQEPAVSSLSSQYGMNLDPRIVENGKDSEFTVRQNEPNSFIQNSGNSDQLQYTLIQPDLFVDINENSKPETMFDDYIYGYNRESDQNQEIHLLADAFSQNTDNNTNFSELVLLQPYYESRYPAVSNEEHFKEMFSSDDNRLPEESYIVEQVLADNIRVSPNVPESSDAHYEATLTDLLRLNSSNIENSILPEIEVVEYIPVDSLRSNPQNNFLSGDPHNSYLRDSVIILDDYQDLNYNLANNDGNYIDLAPLGEIRQSPTSTDEHEMQFPDSLLKFGVRINPTPTLGGEYFSSTDSQNERYILNEEYGRTNFRRAL